jgi:hypothetical protein
MHALLPALVGVHLIWRGDDPQVHRPMYVWRIKQWSLPPMQWVGVLETTKRWGVLCRGAMIHELGRVRRVQPYKGGGRCCRVGL